MLVNFDSLTTVANGIKYYIDRNITGEESQANWLEEDSSQRSFIKNKPFYEESKIYDSVCSKNPDAISVGGAYCRPIQDASLGSITAGNNYTITIGENTYNNVIPYEYYLEEEEVNLTFIGPEDPMQPNAFENYPFAIIIMPGFGGQITFSLEILENYLDEETLPFSIIDESSDNEIIDINLMEFYHDYENPRIYIENAVNVDNNQIIYNEYDYISFESNNQNMTHILKINNDIYTLKLDWSDSDNQDFTIIDKNGKQVGYLEFNGDYNEIEIYLLNPDIINKYLDNCFIEIYAKENIIHKIPFKYQHQVDWDGEKSENQILNKPFGTIHNNFIALDETIEFEDFYAQREYDQFWNIVDTINYSTIFNITFDNILYKNVSFSYSEDWECPIIGDITCEEYPFVIYPYENDHEYLEMNCNSNGNHSIKIEVIDKKIKKIESKYQSSPDWNVLDEDDGSYIKNKPFGDVVVFRIPFINDKFTLNYQQGSNTFYGYYEVNLEEFDNTPLYELFDEGAVADITLNNVKYSAVPYIYDSYLGEYGFGNTDFFYGKEVNQYPFFIYITSENEFKIYFNEDLSVVNFKMEIPIIEKKPIPNEYLPYEIVTELPENPRENTFYIIFE